jgi:glycosyltransferase involved in cell wall biosynthesis
MAVLEAMLYGLPIVGVRQAGLIELVSRNGLLVNSEDPKELMEAIEKILYDPKKANGMRTQSLKLVKEYSIEKTTTKLLNYYQTLLRSKSIDSLF